MKLPDIYKVLVITLSDRAYNKEYEDLSGPRIRDLLSDYLSSLHWQFNISLTLIPDNAEILKDLLESAALLYNIIITTGGTGIGPRDITVETVTPLLTKQIPGVMEYIRVKYGKDKPGALLSRGVAGIIGKSLIYTLPGSVRAVEEYMIEILRTLEHTIQMQYGIDSHKNH